jgi:hypothetical protein
MPLVRVCPSTPSGRPATLLQTLPHTAYNPYSINTTPTNPHKLPLRDTTALQSTAGLTKREAKHPTTHGVRVEGTRAKHPPTPNHSCPSPQAVGDVNAPHAQSTVLHTYTTHCTRQSSRMGTSRKKGTPYYSGQTQPVLQHQQPHTTL